MNNILEETKLEITGAKEDMVMTLPEKLAVMELTKKELEELREDTKDSTEDDFEKAKATFHIRKKLMYLVNDYSVFKQIDYAIEVLDEAIEFHKNKKIE